MDNAAALLSIRQLYADFDSFARACLHLGETSESVTNPYSKESCVLPPIAVAVHDFIKGVEATGLHEPVYRNLFDEAIQWFQVRYPEQYYTLLD